MKTEILKMLLSLGVIIGLAIFVTWWLKRGNKRRFGSSSKIKILERRPLSAKSALYLIEIGGKRMVIADSPAGTRRIADLPTPASSPFGKVLEEVTKNPQQVS